MNILVWPLHGPWTSAFVQGRHRYILPVSGERGPDGHGRSDRWEWPASVALRSPSELADTQVDMVVLQRPVELESLAERWLGGRRPGRDVPAVYLEHHVPEGLVDEMRHPAADRKDIVVVHVTHFNDLFWDTGSTRTRVIQHGFVDPGEQYTGELRRAAVVIDEPPRRGRVIGADLLPRFQEVAPVDVLGDGAEGGAASPTRAHLHAEMARRRVYVHPERWTSLGASLVEAMLLGMPVVALATTAAPEAIPRGAGVVSTRADVLARAVRDLMNDRERAAEVGHAARAAALERFGLARFLADWDHLIAEVVAR